MDASEGFLNTLVEFARLGASGLAIFSIFWIGYLITRKSDSNDDRMHGTLRLFMVYSGIIFIVLVAAGIWGAGNENEAIRKKIEELTTSHDAALSQLKTAHQSEIVQIREQTKPFEVKASVVDAESGRPVVNVSAIPFPVPMTTDPDGNLDELYVRRVDQHGNGVYKFPKIQLSSIGYTPLDIPIQSYLDGDRIKLDGGKLTFVEPIKMSPKVRASIERKSP